MKYKNLKYLFLSALAFIACSEEIEVPVEVQEPLSAGTADFSKFVALGNSLTAGFADGALFKAGQMNAYPNLMSQKFAEVGGGSFTYPEMNDNIGGLLLAGNQIQGPRLFFNGTAPVPVPGTPTTDITSPVSGPFNNLGIPGAKSFHLLSPTYGNLAGVLSGTANPYYVRMNSANVSLVANAVAQSPSFFSLWIGNNDVLSFATSGGVGVDHNSTGNTNPATYGSNDITNNNAFASVYSTLLDALTAGGAKGVVANIPDVTAVPFFTTVPHNPVPLDAATAGALNAQLINVLNGLLTAIGQPTRFTQLEAGANNPLLIVDEALDNVGAGLTQAAQLSGNPQLVALAPFLGAVYGQARHATKDDLILLTTRGVIGQPAGSPVPALNAFGVSYPLQDQYVLVKAEVDMIKAATSSYNATIKSLAEQKGLAIVDVNQQMNILSTNGIIFGNFHMTSAFVQGGAFSLDGVHVTARGNAYIANLFLEAIEKTYGAKFNKFKPESFPLSYPVNLP